MAVQLEFHEWLAEHPEVRKLPCGACKGKGEVEHDCDCEYCTRTEGDECSSCGGSAESDEATWREEYKKQAERDAKALEKWVRATAGKSA